MACLLVVDDDADNAKQLCAVLEAELPRCHDIFWVQDLAGYRQFRRRQKPDLILVELLRHESNGFTLAAAFARQSAALVVLLTDRDLPSDRLWASARGIRHVMSRRNGSAVFAQQISHLLHTGCLKQDADDTVGRYELGLISRSLQDELVISPQAALLACIHDELRLLSDLALSSHNNAAGHIRAGNHNSATRGRAGQLCWLKNLLFFICNVDVVNAATVLIHHAELQSAISQKEHGASTVLCARESLLRLLAPDARSVLKTLCTEDWLEICHLIVADGETQNSDSDNSAHVCAKLKSSRALRRGIDLMGALTFLQDLTAGAGEQHVDVAAVVDAESSVVSFVEHVQHRLVNSRGTDELQNLISTQCLRVLGRYAAAGNAGNRMTWRELGCLCLMLRAVTTQQHWLSTLNVCLSALYGFKGGQQKHDQQEHCQQEAEQLICLTLSLLNNKPAKLDFEQPAQVFLDADSAQRMAVSLAELSQILSLSVPLHQRLSGLMVSGYKLRSYIETSISSSESGSSSWQRWLLVISCFYETVCHGVLQAGLLTKADINDLGKFVHVLQHCVQHGLLPSENTLMNMAALEMTVARRAQSGYGQEHQLLAAGLQRLPKPDRILSDILSDIKKSGSVLSEISHELLILTEGACALGVERVESLARLMLECYQQLKNNPELLQRKAPRLSLSRAHRVLCRLLDQAAAWLPLDQIDAGLALPTVIADLFMQFDYPSTKVYEASVAATNGASTDSMQAALLQCQSLNLRLRQLTRRSGNLVEYRALMAELLREQQAVITPYLRYQQSD